MVVTIIAVVVTMNLHLIIRSMMMHITATMITATMIRITTIMKTSIATTITTMSTARVFAVSTVLIMDLIITILVI